MMKVYKTEKGREKVLKSYDELLKMWDTPYNSKDVQTSFGKTYCIMTGKTENPPLLLFHGVGDNSAIMWPFNIKELSKKFYCIAVDTLGGPGKSVPNERFQKKIFTQRAWINEIADDFGLKTFHIGGVSNGAFMAYSYAIKESHRIEKVVCMEGGMLVNPMKAMISTLAMLFPEILFPTRKNMIKIVKKMSSPYSSTYEKYPQIVDHLLLLMKNHNRNTMFVHKLEKYDKEAAVRIKDKFIFLMGDHKIEKKKDFIDVLKDGGFQYKIVKNAGHGVNHEQPEIVNNEMIGFLLHA